MRVRTSEAALVRRAPRDPPFIHQRFILKESSPSTRQSLGHGTLAARYKVPIFILLRYVLPVPTCTVSRGVLQDEAASRRPRAWKSTAPPYYSLRSFALNTDFSNVTGGRTYIYIYIYEYYVYVYMQTLIRRINRPSFINQYLQLPERSRTVVDHFRTFRDP